MVKKHKKIKPETVLMQTGRDPKGMKGSVNIPPFRSSTFLYESFAQSKGKESILSYNYARLGTPTSKALKEALIDLECAAYPQLQPKDLRAFVFPSGLAACVFSILGLAKAGEHVLVPYSVYGPTRDFTLHCLPKLGIESSLYDPLLGAGLKKHIRPNTKVIFTENPCSITFETQNIPAIVRMAKARGIYVVMDNTWATPLHFSTFRYGVDVCVQSLTKYIIGHSDAVLGSVTATKKAGEKIKAMAEYLGQHAGADDMFLALRGLRSLGVRLRQHQDSALRIARKLEKHPKVRKVLCPALPSDSGYKIFKRDFKGAGSLFAVILKPCDEASYARFFDALCLFGMGFSWGGYESLVVDFTPQPETNPLKKYERLVRLHIGLEDVDDLYDDLAQALEKVKLRKT